MRIPIIKVNDEGYEHIVGSNIHDILYVDERSGGIQYLNMKCCEGTKKYGERQSMQFVTEPMEDYDTFGPQIKLVTIEEFIEIVIQQMKDEVESRLRVLEMAKVYMEEKDKCQKKLKEDTSGIIIL